jgi:16S rRNA (cytidine1402-2'-O)-methyltransferase
LKKALQQIIEFIGPERTISVSRELTKIYEETITGSAEEVFQYYSDRDIKGEIVIVIDGKKE